MYCLVYLVKKKGSKRYCVHLGRLVLFVHFKLDRQKKSNSFCNCRSKTVESELEDDNLGLEQFLDSEVTGVDGGHEANALIRSRRQRGVRKRSLTLINSVSSAATCKGVTTYHSSSVSN